MARLFKREKYTDREYHNRTFFGFPFRINTLYDFAWARVHQLTLAWTEWGIIHIRCFNDLLVYFKHQFSFWRRKYFFKQNNVFLFAIKPPRTYIECALRIKLMETGPMSLKFLSCLEVRTHIEMKIYSVFFYQSKQKLFCILHLGIISWNNIKNAFVARTTIILLTISWGNSH